MKTQADAKGTEASGLRGTLRQLQEAHAAMTGLCTSREADLRDATRRLEIATSSLQTVQASHDDAVERARQQTTRATTAEDTVARLQTHNTELLQRSVPTFLLHRSLLNLKAMNVIQQMHRYSRSGNYRF